MNIEKIEIKKISDSVVEQIEKMIESGTIGPGEKLPSVRELCEMFGVGRSAVRDALLTLKGRGIVDVKQGEGTFVCKFDSAKIFNNQLIFPESKDVHELFQVRKMLEPQIAETAAEMCTDSDITRMESYLKEEGELSWEQDYEFHLSIVKSTKNNILLQFMEFISAMTKSVMSDFHSYIQHDESLKNTVGEQHGAIFEAIKEGNGILANEKMKEHLEFVEKFMEKRRKELLAKGEKEKARMF